MLRQRDATSDGGIAAGLAPTSLIATTETE